MTTPPSVIEAGKALLARADNHAREIAEPLFLEEREALRAALAIPSPVEEGLVERLRLVAIAGREHLQAGNVDDALTAFNQIRDFAVRLAGVLGLRDGPHE